MIIAIGADHRGFSTKELIKKSFLNHQFIDVGAFNQERSDYPIFAHKVVEKIQSRQAERGIMLCGTGIGMVIAANRYKEIYAGVVWNEHVAWQSRAHDNINILALPCDLLDQFDPLKLTDIWLSTEFLGGRYAQRIKTIDEF